MIPNIASTGLSTPHASATHSLFADAPPHQHRHERTRQSHLAKRQERPRRWVRKLEFVVEDKMREDHLHYDGDVEARRAVGLHQLVSTVVEVSICTCKCLRYAWLLKKGGGGGKCLTDQA